MNHFIIKRTKRDVGYYFFNGLVGGAVFYILSIVLLISEPFIGYLMLFICLRHFLYANIELLCDLKISSGSQGTSVTMIGLHLSLDKDDSFFIIDNVARFIGVRPRTEYGLVLVRNSGRCSFLFKNRLKISVGLSIEALAQDMISLSKETGIRHVPFFEDPNKWWW